ncbi:sugar transferase [Lujinxingia sediminis]|uniref:Sugar transferase n=1 Tax=Lujinxingia sediminis TaxID=2480984 RepID=A0ABY0CPB6_9DELT|nr:sugar transferase [Lujinxingia sediminis]RVU42176.1 sugar transferase [Lujinxingia sediminis]
MPLYDHLKRTIDVVAAGAGLVATAPVLAASAAAVYATMGRPLFFRQQRPGLGGEPFELIKFRTMRLSAPDQDDIGSEASRMTPVGQFLRSTSLDELPTLINVLRGEMSLVGPRPLLMRYLPRYSSEQARRHEVRPGVTGWAQINGRNALSWEQKFALDVWYVDHRSLSLDLKILLGTVGKVFAREGINQSGHTTMPEFMGNEASSPSAGNTSNSARRGA